jgi:hypothetical protein
MTLRMIKTYFRFYLIIFISFSMSSFPNSLIYSFYASSIFISIMHLNIISRIKYLMFESYDQMILIEKSIAKIIS